MIITRKVQKEYFKAIMDGRKRFEVRLADFKAQPRDTLVLQEQDSNNLLTGREISCEVLYNLNTKDIERFYTKKDIEKYGLAVLALRKKYSFKDESKTI